MSDINKALGNFGGPFPVHTPDGKEWCLAWADGKILATFCAWLKKVARQGAEIAGEELSEDLQLKLLQNVGKDIAKGKYEPFSANFVRELQDTSGEGWLQIIWLLLERNHKALTLADAEFILKSIQGTPLEAEWIRAVKEVLSAATEDYSAKKKAARSLTADTPTIVGTANGSTAT
jgi:hypothetical protein